MARWLGRALMKGMEGDIHDGFIRVLSDDAAEFVVTKRIVEFVGHCCGETPT